MDIVRIRIGHGNIIDSIQVTYRTFGQNLITKPRRGGPGGLQTFINLDSGEHITGVAGMACTEPRSRYDGPDHIRQLVFFSKKADGQKVVHGPYGDGTAVSFPTGCRVFAVYAKITSIFGKVIRSTNRQNTPSVALGTIGFYYEDESHLSQSTRIS